MDYEFHISWKDKTIIKMDPGWFFNRNSGWLKSWTPDWYNKLSSEDRAMYDFLDKEQVNYFKGYTWKDYLSIIMETYPYYYEECE